MDFSTAGLRVVDGFAYGRAPDVLRVVDVREPTAPRVVATATAPGGGLLLAVGYGQATILSDDGKGVVVYDITDPDAPRWAGSWAYSGEVFAAEHTPDGRIVLAGGAVGLIVLRVNAAAGDHLYLPACLERLEVDRHALRER